MMAPAPVPRSLLSIKDFGRLLGSVRLGRGLIKPDSAAPTKKIFCKREKSIYIENVLVYTDIALAK